LNTERPRAESQPVFLQFAEHYRPLEDLRLAIANCQLKIINQKSSDERLRPTSFTAESAETAEKTPFYILPLGALSVLSG